MAWLRQLLDWQKETVRPGRVPGVAALRPVGVGGLRLHPEGPGHRPARGGDAGRLRLRRAHRGRPPLHRRPGQRPAGAAGVAARQRRHRGDLHLQVARRRPVARLAQVRQVRPGPQQDPAVVLQGAPRDRDRGGQGGHRPGHAQAGPAAAAADVRRGAAGPRPRPALPRRLRALRGRRRGPRRPPRRSCRSWWRPSAGVDGAEEDIAETSLPTRLRGRPRGGGGAGVVVAGDADVWVRLSSCCTPVPGDEIVGFVTRGHGVSVHRADCANVEQLKCAARPAGRGAAGRRRTTRVFLVAIQVEALDRPRLLSDVTRALSDQHVNILSASVTTSRDRVAVSKFTFEMGDPKHLGHVLKAVRGIQGVYDVYRVSGAGKLTGPGRRLGQVDHDGLLGAARRSPRRPRRSGSGVLLPVRDIRRDEDVVARPGVDPGLLAARPGRRTTGPR